MSSDTNLEVFKRCARHLCKQPIKDQTAFDAALTVKDKDDFLNTAVLEGFLDTGIGFSHILGGICEIALYLARN